MKNLKDIPDGFSNLLDQLPGIPEKSDKKLQSHITAHMRYPSGKIEEIKVDESDRFDYNGRVYSLREPLTHPKTGERILLYDVANPYPRLHEEPELEVEGEDDYPDGSAKLMDEISGESIVDQLANPQESTDLDFFGKLGKIPPWMVIAILAFLVLLNQGTLGDIIPFF